MRKKIMLVSAVVASAIALKVYAGTLLAAPGYVAPGCSWNTTSDTSYWPGVKVNVVGLYCSGTTTPVLVKATVTQPSAPYGNGSSDCTMSPSGGTAYTYSSPLTCSSYSVSTKQL